MSDNYWTQYAWFAAWHAHNLTDDFKSWWLAEMGDASLYGDKDTYWMCCAFALKGWHAGRKPRQAVESLMQKDRMRP